jgi:hypothetical protein
MNNIPKKLRDEMAADPFYTRCCITGELGTRSNPIQWHHNLIFAGKQVQEKFCILPIRKSIHDQVHHELIRDRLNWVMLNRATYEELERYRKVLNYIEMLEHLNGCLGVWKEGVYY